MPDPITIIGVGMNHVGRIPKHLVHRGIEIPCTICKTPAFFTRVVVEASKLSAKDVGRELYTLCPKCGAKALEGADLVVRLVDEESEKIRRRYPAEKN